MSSNACYPSLKGKVVFITGGSTGIGAAMVSAFAHQGASVFFVDINNTDGTRLQQQLVKERLAVRFQACDVTDGEDLVRSLILAQSEYGDIGILVNNAANDQRYAFPSMAKKDWDDMLEVNLSHVFTASQVVAPMMKRLGGGAIINFSSVNALQGPKNLVGYAAAKAGLLGLTKALARELGEDNIRVNAIIPGWVATEKQLQSWLTPELEAEWLASLCIKKRILPEDVAKLALFLAADDSQVITAQHFIIDCGKV